MGHAISNSWDIYYDRILKIMTWSNKFRVYYLKKIAPYEHSSLYLLHHCIWFECIRRYMENSNHRFFIGRWLVYNQFMSLSNTFEAMLYHFLLGGMIGLTINYDEFSMVSALMCMVTHWIWPMVSHDIR